MLGRRPPSEGPLPLHPWTRHMGSYRRQVRKSAKHSTRHTVGPPGSFQASSSARGSRVHRPGGAAESLPGPRSGALYAAGRPRTPSPVVARRGGRPACRAGVAAAPPGSPPRRPAAPARAACAPAPLRPARLGASYLQRRRGGRGDRGRGRREASAGGLSSSRRLGGREGRGLRSAGRRWRAPGRPGPAARTAATKPGSHPLLAGRPPPAGPSASRRAGARPRAVPTSRAAAAGLPEAWGGVRGGSRPPSPLPRC